MLTKEREPEHVSLFHLLIGLAVLVRFVVIWGGFLFAFVLFVFAYKTLTLGSTYDLKHSGTRTATIVMMRAAMDQQKKKVSFKFEADFPDLSCRKD